MNIMIGEQIGARLRDALGLPKNTIAFTLRAQVGRVVTVECEYVPEGDAYMTELEEFFLVPRQREKPQPAHPAEVLGYDAWLRQRNERAHRQLMSRCVGIDYGK